VVVVIILTTIAAPLTIKDILATVTDVELNLTSNGLDLVSYALAIAITCLVENAELILNEPSLVLGGTSPIHVKSNVFWRWLNIIIALSLSEPPLYAIFTPKY